MWGVALNATYHFREPVVDAIAVPIIAAAWHWSNERIEVARLLGYPSGCLVFLLDTLFWGAKGKQKKRFWSWGMRSPETVWVRFCYRLVFVALYIYIYIYMYITYSIPAVLGCFGARVQTATSSPW